jgi:hypothetical protein
MIAMVMPPMVRVRVAVMMVGVMTVVADNYDRPANNDRAWIGIDVNDARSVPHDRRVNGRPNFTTAVARMRLIHGHTDQRAGRSSDDGPFSPTIVIVTANQGPRHCPQHRRFANDRWPINFSLRRTDSNRRERESKE